MGINSKIEWCEHTFNPFIGCTRISPACDHCYAADLSARTFKVKWGAGEARKRTSEAYWKQPLKWNDDCEVAYQRYSDAQEQANHIGVLFSEVEPMRPRVFCASLADVFDNEVDPQWRADLVSLIRQTPNLDWMILTKRIGNAEKMMQEACDLMDSGMGVFAPSIYPNVHLGITICNQTEADRDIPKLLATPAAKRFLSIEPMLGPIDLNLGWRNDTWREDSSGRPLPLRRIDLVIAGGESGPRARPSHPDWFRSIRDQCASADVQFMFKQWGEWIDGDNINSATLPTPKITEPSEYFNECDWGNLSSWRVGKKAAGRLLDGAEHNGRIAL